MELSYWVLFSLVCLCKTSVSYATLGSDMTWELDTDDEGNDEGLNATLVESSLLVTQETVSKMQEQMDQLTSLMSEMAQELQEVKEAVTEVEVVPAGYEKVYQLFHIQSSSGLYMFTLAQAREACAARNMVLATLAQLKAAHHQGFGRCKCGWLDDGTVRYAVQWPRQGCGKDTEYTVIRGGCGWRDTWDAYCFK